MRSATLAFVVMLLAALWLYAQSKPTTPRSRKEFAAAMSHLRDGMTTAEVEALLGKPEDVVDEKDDALWFYFGSREAWRYGTSGHLTPATLGSVFIDNNGHAQHLHDNGSPKTDESFDENELRRLLTLIGKVPSYNSGDNFDPLTVVRAVNALQPLGKRRALAVLEEYLRVTSYLENEGSFLVMRALLDVPSPPGYMPRMHVGAAGEEPKDKTLAPRFPLFIQNDIPFLITRGYMLGGQAESPDSHIEHFLHQEIRSRPLQPSLTPFASVKSLVQSVNWLDKSQKEQLEGLLNEQAMRMLDSVYRPQPGSDNLLLPYHDDRLRNRLMTEASQLKLRWDSVKNDYTLADGSSLPERQPIHYRLESWKPEFQGAPTEVTLKRRNQNWVGVELRERHVVGKPGPKVTLRVFGIGSPDAPLSELEGQADRNQSRPEGERDVGRTYGSVATEVFSLPAGEAVQISLEIGDRKLTSPIFKP